MNSTKIQTTVLTPPEGALSPLDKKMLIERLNCAARLFMLDRGYFEPGAVITLEDEKQEEAHLAAKVVANYARREYASH